MAALFARIDDWAASPARRMLGITGPPGVGKSTFTARLVARCAGRAVNVPMDGFHLANSELERLGRCERKGAPDTFDGAGYVALLQRLRADRVDATIYAPEFRRDIEEAVAGAIPIEPVHRLIITEGNYLLLDGGAWSDVRALLDAVWYLEADPALRLERLIARHVRFGRSEVAARAWVASSDERNAALIATTRARADLIVEIG